MASNASDLIAPARLVIVAPNWLGDAVMALPLVGDLRRAWPDTLLTVAARRSVAPLFEMVPAVSSVVTLDGGGGLSAMRAWRANAARLAAMRFDAALLLPNSFVTAWTVARAGIPQRWGYARDLRRRLLTRVLPPPPRDAHQAEYYQALGQGLGIQAGPRHARVEVASADRDRAAALLGEVGFEGGEFVVMAPGAAYGRAKQWLPGRFAQLAERLAGRRIATVLVGTAADAVVCREIRALATRGLDRAPVDSRDRTELGVVDLSGRTDLRTLAAVMAASRAVVANDSGAMHLAAAVGAVVIAIFGATNERKTSPLRADDGSPAPRIVAADVWCRPCMLRECPIDHRCMRRIGAADVLRALDLPDSTGADAGAAIDHPAIVIARSDSR